MRTTSALTAFMLGKHAVHAVVARWRSWRIRGAGKTGQGTHFSHSRVGIALNTPELANIKNDRQV